MSDRQRVIEVLRRGQILRDVLRDKLNRTWLEKTYRASLYGGWRDGSGRWVNKPHRPAIAMHEAMKELFCPVCRGHIGFAPTRNDAILTCKPCDKDIPWRDAFTYSTCLVGGGNRSSKTWSGLSEFVSWLKGVRQWDNSLTAPAGSGRHWLMAGPSHSKAFPTVLCPYFETRASDWIGEVVKNNQKQVQMYIGKNGDIVHCLSYEQYLKIGRDQTNPFEGPTWYGAYFDEPPPKPVWVATRRGLTSSRAAGWGRALIAATPLKMPWMFNDLYQRARNRGGDRDDIFAIEFSIHDNPSLTNEAIEEFLADVPPEEREAREYGRFLHLAGRVYDAFDDTVHITDFDPLVDAQNIPTTWPVVQSVDPHDRKPWFMVWAAISPSKDVYIIREWPDYNYDNIRTGSMGWDEAAAAIDSVEEGIPGGSGRVIRRIMDPNFGVSPKAGITPQDALAERGYFFETDVSNKLEPGHTAVRNLLHYDTEEPLSHFNRPKMFVSESCRNVIKGFMNYTYRERNDMERGLGLAVKDIGKDPMDAIRYLVMADVPFFDWNEGTDTFKAQEEILDRAQGESLY